MTNFRDALLIVRAWIERGSSAPLRASIRLTKDLSNGIEQTVTVTSPEAAAEVVKVWLQDVVDTDRLQEHADQTGSVDGNRQAGHSGRAGPGDGAGVLIEQLNGIDLYYEAHGEGPRLLYFSGSGADLRTHPNVFDGPFASQFEVLSHDQRGLGQTSKPDETYTMADYANDAAGLLDARGWESCHVVGVSFGGMVAQEFALRFPQRVQCLVLACSCSGGAGGSSYPTHEYFDLSAEEAARRRLEVQDTRCGAAWQAQHPDEVRAAVTVREAQLESWSANPSANIGLRRQLEARWAHDTYDRLSQLSMPVFIAGGKYDGQAPPANQEVLHRLIPHSTLEFFEGGHTFMRTDPRAVPRIIEWLSSSVPQ